jgi:regulator of nucleoside diphosphate kinase
LNTEVLIMFATPDIVVTSNDLQRLHRLIMRSEMPGVERLDDELARARVVAPREVASDVVTMNSDVTYEDTIAGARRNVRVVYPEDSDAARGWVSVLSPLGSALLGLRVGQEFDWLLPHGNMRVRILSVPYQPEANGEYTL